MGDFWGDIAEGLGSSDFLGSAVSTLADLGMGLFNMSSQEDAADEAQKRQDEKDRLSLQLEALKARYLGNGGGGGGGASTALTKAQRLAAVQNQGELKVQAINNLLSGLNASYLSGGR